MKLHPLTNLMVNKEDCCIELADRAVRAYLKDRADWLEKQIGKADLPVSVLIRMAFELESKEEHSVFTSDCSTCQWFKDCLKDKCIEYGTCADYKPIKPNEELPEEIKEDLRLALKQILTYFSKTKR